MLLLLAPTTIQSAQTNAFYCLLSAHATRKEGCGKGADNGGRKAWNVAHMVFNCHTNGTAEEGNYAG